MRNTQSFNTWPIHYSQRPLTYIIESAAREPLQVWQSQHVYHNKPRPKMEKDNVQYKGCPAKHLEEKMVDFVHVQAK